MARALRLAGGVIPPRTLRRIIICHALLTGLLTAAVGCGSVSPLKPDGGPAGTGGGGRGGVAGGGSGGTGGSVSCPPTGPCQDCPNGYLTGPDGCQTCECKPGDAGTDQLACFSLFHDCAVDTECCAPNRCLSITGTPQCQQEGPAMDNSQSVTLRLVIPTDHSFCDRCGSGSLITILDSAGQTVETNIPFCSAMCSTCAPTLCPPIVCAAQTVPITNDFTWDGTSVTPSTCGNQVACFQSEFAPAGHYVARMCATPGNLTIAEDFPPTCIATGPVECVDVPFDFPGPSPVVGTLP